MTKKISPSSLEYLAKCPSFESIPGTTPAADAGIFCHKATQFNDFTGLTAEQLEWVKWSCEERDKLINRVKSENPEATVQYEFKSPLVDGLTNGVFDVLILSPSRKQACVVDYKYGQHAVTEVENNYQCYAYALGILNQWPDIDQVMVAIYQAQVHLVDSYVFTREDEDRLFEDILTIYKEVNAEVPIYRPGAHCRWCRNTTSCPICTAIIQHVVSGLDRSLLPEEGIISADLSGLDLMSAENRAKIQKLIPIVEAYIDKVKKSNLDAVMNQGMEIPGYKLFKRSGSRHITSNEKLLEYLDNIGMTAADLMPAANIGITKLVKLVSDDVIVDLDARGIIARGEPLYYLVDKRNKGAS